MKEGEEVEITLEYRQQKTSGSVQLVWARPGNAAIAPQELLDRVKKDGTSLLLLKSAESWMDIVSENTGSAYDGYYSVGRNWIGGLHFVKDHPLFEEPAGELCNGVALSGTGARRRSSVGYVYGS